MKRNPFIGKIKADKDGNIYIREDFLPFGRGLTATENLYLIFTVPSVLKYCGKKSLNSMVGSRVTQWRVRQSLIKKGYGA